MKKEQVFLFTFALLTLAELMMVHDKNAGYLFVAVLLASLCTTRALDAFRPASLAATLPMIAPVLGVTLALLRGFIGGVDKSEHYLYCLLASIGGYIVSLFLLTFIFPREAPASAETSIAV